MQNLKQFKIVANFRTGFRTGVLGCLALVAVVLAPNLVRAQLPAPPALPLPPALPPAATPGGALEGALPGPLTDDGLAPLLDTGKFPIPPVIDRPLDPGEGDRVFINKFVLKGGRDRPQFGIKLDELDGLLENLRAERQGLNEEGEDGFTESEKGEIAQFMRTVIDSDDLDMQIENYQVLVDKLRLDRLKRRAGLTIGQLQEVANVVTEHYRKAGFILATAFIPAQEIDEGVVVIEVLEGKLGNVLAQGNEGYDMEMLAEPFADLVGKPVRADEIESALLTLKQYPGLVSAGVFQPGAATGTSNMLIRVQEEEAWSANLRYDNQGTRFTGKRRVGLDLTVNNPTGAGDKVVFNGLQQFEPKNSFFGSAMYERPFWYPNMIVGASYSRNFFDVGGELDGQGLSGANKVASAWLRKALITSRQQNLSAHIGVDRKNSVQKRDGVVLTKDNLAYLKAGVNYDSINPESRSINLMSFEFSYGLGEMLGGNGRSTVANQDPSPSRRGGNSGKYASNEFEKLFGTFSRLQSLTEHQSMLIRTEAQWTNDLLTTTEQYSIGGANNVRAYPVSEFLVDSAAFASIEWIIRAPGFADVEAFDNLTWGDVLRVSFFSDWATGWVRDPLNTESRITVAGYGASVEVTLPGEFAARIQASRPYGGKRFPDPSDLSNVNPSDSELTHYWFDLTYSF